MFDAPSIPTSYMAVVERSVGGFSAFFPSLPRCTAVGRSMAELEYNAEEAVYDHLKRSFLMGANMVGFMARAIPHDSNIRGVARLFIHPNAH
ncbi:type II toxin-antitoxin system HicB family antitoxin [Sphingomonas sp. SRS2]|uniref:type II toxin-antitoxin system HicB family antitoxin n=1 Tax=Sphingomonas sp. SRS2 TaxID=133190 RepID=UPI0006184D9A|nr:type II toxin-antitoxin system HicB family antitoxin [Sphingomonas sp. SRS2]KKC27782.1 hypothetical protein WP12_00950 [Sphingomonas sp. SRS2]